MKTKLDTERFVFPNGEWQDLPNTTLDESAVVVSKEVDLSTVKYEGGEMVPITQEDLLQIELQQRAEDGDSIVQYLSDYLNTEAKTRGYDSYHTAMIYLNSSYPKFKADAQAFFNCADAIWAYVEENKASFVTTGHPNLEETKLNHPKLEDYLV